MRTLTSPERARLASNFNIGSRLSIENTAGAMVSFSGFQGVSSWLLSATGDATIDNPVETAEFKLLRTAQVGATTVSLSPFMDASPANTSGPSIYLGRLLRFETAVTAPGVTPATGDWRTVFYGVIVSVDPGSGDEDVITVRAADLGSKLANIKVNRDGNYSSDAGSYLYLVLQQILTEWAPGVTLRAEDPPDWQVTGFTLAQDSLLTDLRNLALQIGYDVRYRFYGASQTPELGLFLPLRDNTTPDLTLPASEYVAINGMPIADDDIRNRVRVIFTGQSTPTSEGAITADEVQYVEVDDPASIAAYGVRYMEISEAATSNIDTAEEARAMATAAVSDLSQPYAVMEVQCFYLWPVQLGDIVALGANGVLFDGPQQGAVQAIHWTVSDGHGETTLTLRGKPSGAFRAWLDLESRGTTTPDAVETKLSDIRYEDSADGKRRTYSYTPGKRVAFVWAFARVADIPIHVEDWPGEDDVPSGPGEGKIDVGVDRFTVDKPPHGFQTLVELQPFYTYSGSFRRGPSWKVVLDPTPSVLDGKVHATRSVPATATLTVGLTASPSDYPVRVDVYEDDPDGVPLATFTVAADGTTDASAQPALGGRPLPLRGLVHWYLQLTNVAGVSVWGSPASLDRDPLPTGELTPNDFRATAGMTVAYDGDTDAGRVTSPDGGVTTFAGLTGSGTFTYAAGVTVRDDLSIEATLGVGETRPGYLVEVFGGGVWVPLYSGPLHGEPANPPTVLVRPDINPDRSREDIYATVQSYADERVTLRLRDGDGTGAPLYHLVAGAGDVTPLFVDSGTEIGPAYFFRTVSGSPVAKLSGVALSRDQVRRYYVQAVGEESGIEGAWVTVPLSLLEQPYLDAATASFNETTNVLTATVTGSAHCQSVAIIADDDAAFGSPLSAVLLALADGQTVKATWTLSGAQLGRMWQIRATPYNLAGQAGLSGNAMSDAIMVPANYLADVTVPTNDTVRVVVVDPGGVVDPAQRVKFYTTTGNGARTLRLPTIAPSGTTTTGTYELAITLDPKHPTLVEPVLYLRDGSVKALGGQTLDLDTQADVVDSTVAYAGAVATPSITWDSDTVLGSGAEASFDGGSSWLGLSVPSNRVTTFNVAMSASSNTSVLVRGINAQGERGVAVTVIISKYIPAASTTGPSLNAVLTAGTFSDTISYTYSGSMDYRVNGVPTSLPASPFLVSRPAAGGNATALTFSVTANGQTVSEVIRVEPIDSDTVDPDVQLNPLSTTNTQLAFSAYAVNPKTGSYINATFSFTACSGTVNGSFVSAGGSATAFANGITIVANRPSLGQVPGTVKMRAVIGIGSAEHDRTISESTIDFTPPVFEPQQSTSTTFYTFVWATPGGAAVYAQTDGSGYVFQSGTSYSVSRNSAGGAAKTVYLKAVNAAGVENVKTFSVPPMDPTGGGSTSYAFTSYSAAPDYSGNAFNHFWNGTFPGTAIFRIWGSEQGSDFQDLGVWGGTFGTSPTQENIDPSGGPSETFKFYIVCEDGAAEICRSVTRTYVVKFIP